jgi:hypothetical protein
MSKRVLLGPLSLFLFRRLQDTVDDGEEGPEPEDLRIEVRQSISTYFR